MSRLGFEPGPLVYRASDLIPIAISRRIIPGLISVVTLLFTHVVVYIINSISRILFVCVRD